LLRVPLAALASAVLYHPPTTSGQRRRARDAAGAVVVRRLKPSPGQTGGWSFGFSNSSQGRRGGWSSAREHPSVRPVLSVRPWGGRLSGRPSVPSCPSVGPPLPQTPRHPDMALARGSGVSRIFEKIEESEE
jgi:hypothetical protein